MSDTTSELRQLFEKTDGYALELQKNGEPYDPDMYYLYKDVVALLAAQRQRWEAETRAKIESLRMHQEPYDTEVVDTQRIYWNDCLDNVLAALDGELGKEQ